MTIIATLTAIFGWAFFSFWSAIPAGLALQVTPLLVLATVTLSYASGVVLIVAAGVPLRQRIQRHFLKNSDPLTDSDAATHSNRGIRWAKQAWDRFGLIGLALLAPMTLGSQLGAVVGLAFGARPLRLIVTMTLGAALWATVIIAAIGAGMIAIR